MSDPTPKELTPRFFAFSRRSFVQMAGATGAVAALTRWSPSLLAQSTGSANSIAPVFPGLPGNQGMSVGSASQIQFFLQYDPAKDPDAKYFRSRVPVAQRVAPFAPTQAWPELSSQPRLTNLSWYYNRPSDSNNNVYQYERYGNTAGIYVPRFQQYQDIVGGWNGAQSLPTSAYIDTAHRNGALSIGIVFQPGFIGDTGDPKNNFLVKGPDGSFLVGDKLVDNAQYFGFDGYFFNIEAQNTDASVVKPCMELFAAMQKRAKAKGMPELILQMYACFGLDGSSFEYDSRLDSSNAGWLTAGGLNSLFMQYFESSDDVQASAAQAKSLRLDPFNSVYFGLQLEESSGGGLSYIDTYGSPVIPPNGVQGKGQASLALFDPVSSIGNRANAASTDPNVQIATAYELDRQLWSGYSQNPALTSTEAITNGLPQHGVAGFIAERSVISSFPFVSRFNTGTGDKFFIEGVVSNPNPWFNIGVQDILPTWQWWTKDFYSYSIPQGLLSVDYDMTTAWDGGSSLKVSGRLGPNNPTEVRLFKTKVSLPLDYVGRSIYITYKAAQAGPTNLYVGLIFEDDPTQTIWLSVDDSKYNGPRDKTDWSQVFFTLFNYRGRTIAAISLGFKVGQHVTTASPYAVNIGEVALLDSTAYGLKDTGPSNLAIEQSQISSDGTSAQVRLTWNYDPTVWYYDIYRRNRPNALKVKNMTWLGRISSDCYYVSNLPRLNFEKSAVIQLYPIALDGTSKFTASSTVKLNW